MGFSALDFGVFIGYCLFIIGLGLWVSRDKKGHEKDSQDYFLASRSLPWWAVGASLIASNISAEQFIGMSGSGYALGLAISTYEWMAAATLLVVGKFFLPIYIKKGIYTMPQFLADRYNDTVRTFMAIFWLLVYVFVNLTSVIYLGALSIETVLGVDLIYAIIGLALFALLYSIYGGLMAVAWTDVVQVIFLVLGGLATTYLALDIVGDGDIFGGLARLRNEAPDHFHMILEEGFMITDGQGGTTDAYQMLPGISVLIGGMWIVNLSYWGFNQYITQRALAAKNLDHAQRGVVFAGILKLLIPLIVVIPGIAAFVIVQNDAMGGDFTNIMTDPDTGFIVPDRAYPSLLSLLPNGMKGVAFAALTAAIVSSLASMANSTSTIFTMDIYRNYINKNASEHSLVRMGRIVVVVSFIIACLVAPALQGLGQVFQYIQEYTGYVSPGVFVIFVFGVFWKKTTPDAALTAAILTIPLSAALAFFFPELPFIDRMGVVFLILATLMIVISLVQSGKDQPNSIELSYDLFKTSRKFNVGALLIIGILAALYIIYW
ncbi:SSS family solute:Na+ symporter [Catalinimonas alkaloidigena]|uniref:sodium/sugar symporter n=1 Tax=Catalinimonas alkaloidigena TaxID=1075417 RepID=UPI0024055CC1|nr:sodium/sugar symporter [Catalinimonas alkaloidigena]MDF9800519.1 SSS family solute:Na+ symporter [Catalinimonas alkaloidigena]